METYSGDNKILNWKGCPSWCQEKAAHDPSMRIVRGGDGAKKWESIPPSETAGWRPILEPIGINDDQFRGLLMEGLLKGTEMLIWGDDLVLRGILMDHTPYDLILVPSPGWTLNSSEMHQISKGRMIVDRAGIQYAQLGRNQN